MDSVFVFGVVVFVVTVATVVPSEAAVLATGVVVCPNTCLCTVAESASTTNGTRATSVDTATFDGGRQFQTGALLGTSDVNSTVNSEDIRAERFKKTPVVDDLAMAMTRVNCRNKRIIDMVDTFKETSRRNIISL